MYWKVWKEEAVAYFNMLSQHLPEGALVNMKTLN